MTIMNPVSIIKNILNEDEIEMLLNHETVLKNKNLLENTGEEEEEKKSIHFSLLLSPALIDKLNKKLNCDLIATNEIPFKWIKGDTLPHSDRDAEGNQYNTHLIYLTDNTGKLRIGEEEEYNIIKGCGYIFAAGLMHETINTENALKLILGPFNYKGDIMGGAIIISNTWQDASAIWQPGTGGFDSDISFNGYSGSMRAYTIYGWVNNTLAYDAINNKIYAAGNYSSNAKNGAIVPFVSWSEDGVQWQDASAIWQSGFDNDISFNVFDPQNISSFFNFVAALAYDSSDNRIYAGGAYPSKSSNGNYAPFVAYSSDAGINWQDASAIWQPAGGAFNTDGSNNQAFLTALAYSQYQNRIYAGGFYFSNANSGYSAPFVSWSNANDGITWSDASAMWHTAFDSDISFNEGFSNGVTSLTYVTNNNRIYAGGYYISKANNGFLAPFVAYSSDAGITWQDASAIWHGNTFDGDISFNNSFNTTNGVTSLTYDSLYNRIYAGGSYFSIANEGKVAPFVAWTSADDGVNWYDASAIWQNGFNGDISFNNNPNVVTSLTYDSSQGVVYAGGNYASIANSGNNVPFISSSSNGIYWQDASAIWQGNAFDSDISGNKGGVSALTYDASNDRVYANGFYSSKAKSGLYIPFVANNVGTPYVPPPPPPVPNPYPSSTWQDASAVWHGNTFDGDISFNDFSDIAATFTGSLLTNNLAYDLSNNRIYSGGTYSNKDNIPLPYVAWSNNGVNWQDASAIWHSGFDSDISFVQNVGNISFSYNSVSSLLYVSNNNNIYAGGTYFSIANNNHSPFVARSQDGVIWQDASAIWKGAFDADISYANGLINTVYALSNDSSNNIIYAGGGYPSIANGNNISPFVARSVDNGVTWQDASAIWHSGFNDDKPNNVVRGLVKSLIYNNYVSGDRIYAGGFYDSSANGSKPAPFVCYSEDFGITWQYASAIWQTAFNGDISFNSTSTFSNSVNSLAYDSSHNRIYAGGKYISKANGGRDTPFVAWTNVSDGVIWQDASAIWQPITGAFTNDISNNEGVVNSLTYDSNQGLIYAGGLYISKSNNTGVPFVAYSSDGVNWYDASAIWQGNAFDNDISGNQGLVSSLTYDAFNERVYANGNYLSKENGGHLVPFVANNVGTLSVVKSIWQDASAIWQPGTGGFDGDISFNSYYSPLSSYFFYGYFNNNLVYDSIHNRIYASGNYSSKANNGNYAPFVAWSSDGVNWQDASAIWHGSTFNGDISFNNNFGKFNSVAALTYDSSNNRIYAGGMYSSIENSGNYAPFVAWSSDGVNWQDASAIWQTGTGAFDDDISFNSINIVTSLTYINNRIYAGGMYYSYENSGNFAPFVAWTNADDGVNWQDASAIWHTGFEGDLSFNKSQMSVNDLLYDSSRNRIYAGGMYSSNANQGTYAPFVAWSNDGMNWQDASAIWHGNTFDGDISFNGNLTTVNSLTYDSSRNRIYAGGIYSSKANNSNSAPFVAWSSDGVNWQDASAIWQTGFDGDITFNSTSNFLNSVNSLAYDSSQGLIYAGGAYYSKAKNGKNTPFVVYSSDGVNWHDASAIWQGGFDNDIKYNADTTNPISSLTYDASNSRVYANGIYSSKANSGYVVPFVSNNGGTPPPPPPPIPSSSSTWQDASAIWQPGTGGFDGDISFNNSTNSALTYSFYGLYNNNLVYDSIHNRIYAGGTYGSNANSGSTAPFVASSSDGVNWQDASAIWHTGFDNDISLNNNAYFNSGAALTYDSSQGLIYAGGSYSSKANNGATAPFVAWSSDGVNWQDASAIWHTGFDGDMSFNSYNFNNVTSLTYDSSNNRIYAGGSYLSKANSGDTAPFVASSTDGVNWQDASAIWHTGFDGDISLNNNIVIFNIVTSLTYDSSQGLIYAGGTYSSIANSGALAPFVASSTDGVNWQDASAIWHTGFDGDISFNNSYLNNVTSLTYDSSNNRIYAGGSYGSKANSGALAPFVASSTDGVNWQDASAIWHTGFDGDISFNDRPNIVTSLTYDSSQGLIYAGGTYSSIAHQGLLTPFICSSSDGVNWQDASAIWQGGFDNDISYNNVLSNIVSSLTYDTSNDRVYASGFYSSKANDGYSVPFVSNNGGTPPPPPIPSSSSTWQDASAIWHGNTFDGDISLNNSSVVNALTYDSSNNRIYAGGNYSSKANQDNYVQFVAWSNDGIIWQDASAIWHDNTFDGDISLNDPTQINQVYALTYDSSRNRIYAGGSYSSNANGNNVTPFVVWTQANDGVIWQDASAIWHSGFDGDINFTFTIGFSISNFVNTLTYVNNRIYAGGGYNSTANQGNLAPFVAYSTDGIIWQDASAIWHSGFDGDISLNSKGDNGYNIVSAVTYDNNRIYAGGAYSSKANQGNPAPYVTWSQKNDGVNWHDASAIWQSNAFDNDISGNVGFVSSLTYDSSRNRIYAGGAYFSKANGNNVTPFVAYSTDEGITWQDASAIWHSNAFDDDINYTTGANGVNAVTSLTYDSSQGLVYAGGNYSSKANGNSTAPFVAYSADGINWYDASAIWQGGFDGDISYNVVEDSNELKSLTYNTSNSRVYAGGSYLSIANGGTSVAFVANNAGTPYVPPPPPPPPIPSPSSSTWQDASAIWQPGTGGFDGDISFNNTFSFILFQLLSSGYFHAPTAYDSSRNRIYAGGAYSSITNEDTFTPFVTWSNDGINWQDASAIWHGNTFDGDLSFNRTFNSGSSVTALTYDSSRNRIYAGGGYGSKANQGTSAPFVAWSTDGMTWQDASAIWHGNTFDGDISFNNSFNSSSIVSALTYDSSRNRVYASGNYTSNANQGTSVPFVAWSNDGIIWQDASAIWQGNTFDGDISFNKGIVSSLVCDTNDNRVYVGGTYDSNANQGTSAPFVAWTSDGVIWQDASAIWHGNTFDGDLSFNNRGDAVNSVYALTYDSSRNRIYAGGAYNSNANQGNRVPFVAWSTDGVIWQDASAIWHGSTFAGDISFNNSIFNNVNSLTYDSSQGLIYAGGSYSSKANPSEFSGTPFVAYSSDGVNWYDASAIWQDNAFDNDISGNIGLVSSLTYDLCNNRVYANGIYSSKANSGYVVPFVANNGGTPLLTPPYSTIEFNANGNIFLNGVDSGITSDTYYLKISEMATPTVTITNNLTGGQIGTVKLQTEQNASVGAVPPGQFIIAGNNITIDGQNVELDLSQKTNYAGLVTVANNSIGIIIENININLGTNAPASLSGNGYSGWVCHGQMSGVEIYFTNCQVNAGGDLYVSNDNGGDNGGICGGTNSNGNGSILSFTNCQLNAGGDLYVSNGNGVDNGGICGGSSSGSFTDCQVNAGGDLYVSNGNGGNGRNGGICGGSSSGTFTDCTVSASGDLYVNNNSGGYGGNGGICGGNNNNSTLSFTNCHVNAGGDLYVNNDSSYANGGICGGESSGSFTACHVNAGGDLYVSNASLGGYNGGICGGGSDGTFTNCQVNAGGDLYVNNNGDGNNGGICGGESIGTFTDCQVSAGGEITINNGGSGESMNGGICGGGNTSIENTTYNLTNCQIVSNANLIVTNPNISSSISTMDSAIFGGGNGNGNFSNNLIFNNCQVLVDATNPSYWSGTFDKNFNNGYGGFNSSVTCFAVQPNDGKIIVGGNFTAYTDAIHGTIEVGRIARLNPDGTLDLTFNTGTGNGFDDVVNALAIQPNDGKIIVGGVFMTYTYANNEPIEVGRIARLNAADGSLDLTFNTGPGKGFSSYVYTLAIQPNDGKIIVGGYFTQYVDANETINVGRIARLNPNGSLDTNFNTGTGKGFNDAVNTLIIQPNDGKIVVGGYFTQYVDANETNAVGRIARLNATDGSLDMSFNNGVGKGFNGAVSTLIIQPNDGKIVVGGNFTSYLFSNTSYQANYIVRLNATDGSVDTSFINEVEGDGFDNSVTTLIIQPNDGKIVVGGSFNTYNFNDISYNNLGCITRLNPADGSIDQTFSNIDNGGFDGGMGIQVAALALQANGKILVGGYIRQYTDSVKNTPLNYIARLNSGNGILDTAFNRDNNKRFNNPVGTGFVFSQSVNAFAVQPLDGKVVVGGNFTNYSHDGVTYLNSNAIIRLNSVDGSIDESFIKDGSGFINGGLVNALAIQPTDNKIIVGGQFSIYYDSILNMEFGCNSIARLNSDGSFDELFGSYNGGFNFNGKGVQVVRAVAIQPNDGKIVVGGFFDTYTDSQGTDFSCNAIARLDSSGNFDALFGSFNGGFISLNSTPTVNVLAIQSDNKIIVGGQFDSYYDSIVTMDFSCNSIARLNPDGSFDESLGGFNFNGKGVRRVNALAIQPNDGKIVVGGLFDTYTDSQGINSSCGNIARLNSDGTFDTTFLNSIFSGDDGVSSLILQPDGKIVVGGQFIKYTDSQGTDFSCNNIARLNPDGTFDATFSTVGFQNNAGNFNSSLVSALALQPNGKIFVGGSFENYTDNQGNVSPCNNIASLNSNNAILIGGSTSGPGTFNANGGICGGNNTFINLSAANCTVNVFNSKNTNTSTFLEIGGIGLNQDLSGNTNANGGIFGGFQIGPGGMNTAITNCQLLNNGRGNINITGTTRYLNNGNGGMCGGFNMSDILHIVNCQISLTNNFNNAVVYLNQSNSYTGIGDILIGGTIQSGGGGTNMCGGMFGGNNYFVRVIGCSVNTINGNIIIAGTCSGNGINGDGNENGSNANGGIGGGWNLDGNVIITSCKVVSGKTIEISGTADLLSSNANGGMCGGWNGYGIAFADCQVVNSIASFNSDSEKSIIIGGKITNSLPNNDTNHTQGFNINGGICGGGTNIYHLKTPDVP